MTPNFRIALRFLTAKKRAMLMSLSCTVLGVGLFIVTQATTSGFEDFFVDTILGTDGAMRIEDKEVETLRTVNAGSGSDFQYGSREGIKYIEGVEHPKQITDAVKEFSNVRAVSAIVRGNVQVTSAFKTEDAQVLGIDLDNHLQVSHLAQQVPEGGLDKFRESAASAIIGRVLADRLQIKVDDSITIVTRGGAHPRRFKVAAVNESGYREFDKVRIYIDIKEARSLLNKPTGASLLQISLKDPDRAPADAAHMQEVLKHSAKPWQEREKVWLGVFHALRVSSAITVMVFTLIASLAMFNTLAMIVLEKTKDIAILRSMGYERRDITQIFLWQAGIVLAIGSALGAAFGAIVTYGVSCVPLPINTIFKTDYFIVSWNPWHYAEAIVTAVIMVMIASLVPARRAAHLEPGDIIRGTAQ